MFHETCSRSVAVPLGVRTDGTASSSSFATLASASNLASARVKSGCMALSVPICSCGSPNSLAYFSRCFKECAL